MHYINTETGEDDLSEAQVRAAFPDTWHGPAEFPPAPFAERHDTPQPAFDPITQDVVRVPSVLVSGAWRQAWSAVTVSAEVQAQRQATATEAARLAAIDTTIAQDATIASLRAMTNAQFDSWWSANVTTLAQLNNVVKRIARVLIRRVL